MTTNHMKEPVTPQRNEVTHSTNPPETPRDGTQERILIVGTRSDVIGGSNVYIRDYAVALRRDGFHVTVAAGGSGVFADMLDTAGITYVPLKFMTREVHPLQDVHAIRELRQVIQYLKPHVLSLQTSKAGAVGRLAAVGSGIPVMYTPHAWAFAKGVPQPRALAYAIIERALAPLASVIINVSEADLVDATRYGVGGPHQHVVIRNGVPDVPAEYRADPSAQPPRITMIARFEPQKDHATLLRALARLKHRDWTLELIGDGPGRARVQDLTKELDLTDRIVFTPVTHDVPGALARTQIFVLASLWEGLPLTILEAQRAGLPVIASLTGGNPEVVNHQTGILVTPGDAAALAEALEVLIMNPHTRVELGRNAREQYLQRSTAERTYRDTVRVTRDVIKATKPRSA